MSGFPFTRLRRLRQSPLFRELVRETKLDAGDLILPLFIRPGKNEERAIASMPGQFQISVDLAVREAKEAARLGIPALLLFGIPKKKDPLGSDAYSKSGVIQTAVREIKSRVPDILVITDLCFCEYTSHGHCGVVKKSRRGGEFVLDNDATLEIIGKTAAAQAEAGSDIIAPSGMIDGMVCRIRGALDKGGFKETPILSYAAKYASSFYAPFREAAEGAPRFGDRRSYQMDPANAEEALREVKLDIKEGADIVMVKPALPYLDIIRRVRETFKIPVAAYNVSGEYAMVKAAAGRGWLDGEKAALEILLSIKRAGADCIITYHAKEVAKILETL